MSNSINIEAAVAKLATIQAEIDGRSGENKANTDANRTAKLDIYAGLIVALVTFHEQQVKWTKSHQTEFRNALGKAFAKKSMARKLAENVSAACGISCRAENDPRPVGSRKLPAGGNDDRPFVDIALNDGAEGVLAYFKAEEILSETQLVAKVFPKRGLDKPERLALAVFKLSDSDRDDFEAEVKRLEKEAEAEAKEERAAA